jgi:Tfp pilus assembly protein PilX
MNFDHSKPGFVILFAVLISVIVLLIGFGMYNIAIKESFLSSAAEEAQYSFMAADGGLECVLQSLADTIAQGTSVTNGTQVSCYGQTYAFSIVSPDSYEVVLSLPPSFCAKVTYNEIGTDRVVYSQGYNRCTSSGQPEIGNPKLVERVLELDYSVGGSVGSQTPTPPATPGGSGSQLSTPPPANPGSQ